MPESIFFKSPEHKERFLAAIKPHIHSGVLDAEYGSALYLLTSERSLWPQVEAFVHDHEIHFRELIVKIRMSTTERGMVLLAQHLLTSSEDTKVNLFNSLFSGEVNYRLALTAFEIRRQRMSIDRFN